MKRLFSIFAVLIPLSSVVLAQSANDVIRLSQTYPTGTARSMAMGGAFGALGADLSSPSINPAGLGLYRRSEMAITPMLSTAKSSFDLMDKSSDDVRNRLSINNIGYAGYSPYNYGKFKSMTWSIGINRLVDFNQDFSWNTKHATSSLLDEFTANANNNGDPYLPDYLGRYDYMAFNVFAMDTAYFYQINPITGQYAENPYFHDLLNVYNQEMGRSISRRGRILETYLALGFNVNDMLYFGASLNLQEVSFKEKVSHYEFVGAQATYMHDFNMLDKFEIEGAGYNVKLGAIVRPTQEILIGLAYHTPTWYVLEAGSFLSMSTRFYSSPSETGERSFYDKNEQYFDYKVRAPGRLRASWACVIPSTGMISVDYEFIDYTQSKMTAKNDPEYAAEVTDDVKKQFRATGNLHIGGELLLTSNMSLRAGFANLGNPARKGYFNGDKKDQRIVSAGVGYRAEDAYIEFSWQHAMCDQDLWVYNDLNGQSVCAGASSATDRIAVTLGVRL